MPAGSSEMGRRGELGGISTLTPVSYGRGAPNRKKVGRPPLVVGGGKCESSTAVPAFVERARRVGARSACAFYESHALRAWLR